MTNITRICEYCTNEYQNIYTYAGTTNQYTIPTRFCSKFCAGKFKYLNTVQNINKPLPSKEIVTKEVTDFILSQNRYCTSAEIRAGINRSSKSLTNLEIYLAEENRKLGFLKPKSMFENTVKVILEEEFDNVEYQKEFKGLVGITGYPLRVDFYLPDLNLVIEADGSQHKDVNHPWANSNPNGSISQYDDIKNSFFNDNEIRIIRIPYKRNISKNYVLSFISI